MGVSSKGDPSSGGERVSFYFFVYIEPEAAIRDLENMN
jgi:hypothetical protein